MNGCYAANICCSASTIDDSDNKQVGPIAETRLLDENLEKLLSPPGPTVASDPAWSEKAAARKS